MQSTLHIPDLAQKVEDTKINTEKYPYRTVHEVYRTRITKKNFSKQFRNTRGNDPMIIALLEGKTVLVDAKVALHEQQFPSNLRTLYNYFNVRGYRLRMHFYDDLDLEVYRGILMWAEPLVKVYQCSRCEEFTWTNNDELSPALNGCPSVYKNHSWKQIKKRLPKDKAA